MLKYLIIYEYIYIFAHRCQSQKENQCIQDGHTFPEPLPENPEPPPADEFTF